jgi:hypothetical protein
MDNKDKASLLARLNEDQLREQVLIPLLGRIGFRSPILYHGSREHGKDIICFDVDRLGQRIYMGVVAKKGDINGAVASDKGIWEVCRQVQQCFDKPYDDLFGMKQVTMDYVWVITNGRILASASDSIYESLKKSNLSKLIRFIQVEQLVAMIDEHFAAYWNQADESIESVRAQRDRALRLCGEIIGSLGATKQEIETICIATITFPV